MATFSKYDGKVDYFTVLILLCTDLTYPDPRILLYHTQVADGEYIHIANVYCRNIFPNNLIYLISPHKICVYPLKDIDRHCTACFVLHFAGEGEGRGYPVFSKSATKAYIFLKYQILNVLKLN
jgi:hypothetical protein